MEVGGIVLLASNEGFVTATDFRQFRTTITYGDLSPKIA